MRGLIVDWGGVLTAPLDDAMTEWARIEGINLQKFREAMADWVGAGSGDPVDAAGPASNELGARPVQAMERGELATGEFEVMLSAALRDRGVRVRADGLLTRMLAGLTDTRDDMVNLLRRARGRGIRTALLSNSWGEHYPEHAWVGAFDSVVISGRVGMRKPEPAIYRYAARQLDLPPAACVFVDDLARNVQAAVAVGMVGILHTGFETTLAELDVLFGTDLG